MPNNAALSVLVIQLFATACTVRVSAVECIRFDSKVDVTIDELTNVLYEYDDRFSVKNYAESFTQRQQKAGERWTIARNDATEVSIRSHDLGFSDICVYDQNDGEGIDQAMEALDILSSHLRLKGVAYEYPD